MLPNTHKLASTEKNMEWGAPVAADEHNLPPRRGYRFQPRESLAGEYGGGFPTEGRLAGRLQMGGDRRRENWRSGGSEWRGRGRFGRNGPGPGYGRGNRDGYNSWGGRWYDRGRGFRGRGRNWHSPQWGQQHVESGGYFRKDEIAPERYNPGGDPQEDLAFVNNRPANWEYAGRWPKSEDLDEEGKPGYKAIGNVPMEKAVPAEEGPTKVTKQGVSLSPSPHSLMTVKRSPSQPVARRRPRDYRSECPSPSTDESMDEWPNGSQDEHNSMKDDYLPEKENGAMENEIAYTDLASKSEIATGVASQVFPVVMDMEVSKPLMEIPEKPSTKSASNPLQLNDPPLKHGHGGRGTKPNMQRPMLLEMSDHHPEEDEDTINERTQATKHHKIQSTGSPQGSPSRKQRSAPKSQKSCSRSRTPSRSASRSKSKSKDGSVSRSRTGSGSRSRSRSQSMSRSRSSSRSRSEGSKSSHSRQHRARQSSWKDRRYHYDDRRGRDHRPERGRHFIPRGRFDPNRYRNGPPGPGWMRNGGGYRGRFGGGQFRRYTNGPRYGGGSRYMRDRPAWNRPGDRRAIGRYGDRDKPYERRSRSRERPRRGRNESQDQSPHRRRSPSRSKSHSSRGTTPTREIKGSKRAASGSSESPARRKQSTSPKPARR